VPKTPFALLNIAAWPAVADNETVRLIELLEDLEHSQWWSLAKIHEHQQAQLSKLLAHCYETVPFYRKRLQAIGYDRYQPLTAEQYSRLPLLRREEVQSAGPILLSRSVPDRHGPLASDKTSGSSGRPITCYSTNLAGFVWRAITLRDHAWHRRDFRGKLAVIRAQVTPATHASWGSSTDLLTETGPCVTLDIATDIAEQVTWLQQQQPNYLLTYPSNLRALLEHCLQHGIRLPALREIRTISEIVDTDLRRLCQQALAVPLVDLYSAVEIGNIALQCPDHQHYHVQSETLLVEILDADGQPCAPGQVGRVILTPLYNYAMPLLRYEIQDFAVPGEACSCGRGLPVIERILGRQRNMLTLPDGRQHWPLLGYHRWAGKVPIRQIQLVQHTPERIEAKLVTTRPMTAEERQFFISIAQNSLGYPFEIDITYHSEIPRSAGGKYEDFISLLANQ